MQPPTHLDTSAHGCALPPPVSPRGPNSLRCFLSLLRFSVAWHPEFKPSFLLSISISLSLSLLCFDSFPLSPIPALPLSFFLLSPVYAESMARYGANPSEQGPGDLQSRDPQLALGGVRGAQVSSQPDPASKSLHGGKTFNSLVALPSAWGRQEVNLGPFSS